MMTAISGHTIGSVLWFTGMTSNDLGARIGAEFGVNMNFGNWLFVASVPCIIALVAIPFTLFKRNPAEIKYMPKDPAMAKKVLHDLGSMSRQKWIIDCTFFGMILLWVFQLFYI
jgi:DASS family divalent anion:Na+ symporter